MVRVASYIQQNTESTWHHINLCRSVIYAYALCYKERDWEEEANFTASSSQSSFCIYYKGSCKLHYQEKRGSVEKYWGVFFSFIVFCIFAL